MDEIDITVLGGGISGITTALTLELDGYSTRLVTAERGDRPRNRPAAFASLWGAGAIHPHAVEMEDLDAVFADSVAAFRHLARSGSMGVRTQRQYWIDETGGDPPHADALFDPEDVGPGEAPSLGGEVTAVRSRMLFAEMQAYLPRLYYLYEAGGGSIERRRVERDELSGLPGEAVVNCTGYWSRELFDDDAFRAVRGHMVRAEDTAVPTEDGEVVSYVYNPADGEGLYAFPRMDAVFLGGTHQEGTPAPEGPWDGETTDGPVVDLEGTEVPERIVEDNRALLEQLGVELSGTMKGCIGYRPVRDEVCLERTEVDGTTVVHNYGHGGAGITLSWGSAVRVASLLEEVQEPGERIHAYHGGDAVANRLGGWVRSRIEEL